MKNRTVYTCITCQERKIERAFIKGYWTECRKCVKEQYIFYKIKLSLDK